MSSGIPETQKRIAPWSAGLRAARANLVPGLIIQLVMLALLLGYHFYPPTRFWLDQLAALKESWGYGYSVLAAIIAGAIIPEIMRIIVFQRGKADSRNLRNLLFSLLFWSFMGFIVDAFYRSQALWFGDESNVRTVTIKVLVDQFIYNPVFAAPFTACMYDWKNSGYRRRVIPHYFSWHYYRDAVIPTLFATWGVWIPIVTILYSLPSLLQIPLFALALSLWVMIYTWMSEQRSGK
ncbi:hypothetical protein ACFSSA_02510 [Luteolibacter algae]|uniref:Uncharacterized protein n=1 Tax=Luteolibacter algae TaxID=454151 RepID=A0ABW5D4B3_9BACT